MRRRLYPLLVLGFVIAGVVWGMAIPDASPVISGLSLGLLGVAVVGSIEAVTSPRSTSRRPLLRVRGRPVLSRVWVYPIMLAVAFLLGFSLWPAIGAYPVESAPGWYGLLFALFTAAAIAVVEAIGLAVDKTPKGSLARATGLGAITAGVALGTLNGLNNDICQHASSPTTPLSCHLPGMLPALVLSALFGAIAGGFTVLVVSRPSRRAPDPSDDNEPTRHGLFRRSLAFLSVGLVMFGLMMLVSDGVASL